jgi:hypothetical protein
MAGGEAGRLCGFRYLAHTEVNPNPNPNLRGVVHIELITKNGIFNHENLDFTELIRDQVYEFTYIFVPVPLKGATGSPGSPIAVR